MLRVADRIVDEDDVLSLPPVVDAPVYPNAASTIAPPASRYGASRSPNWLAIALILIVHAVLISAIMHVRHQAQRREEARLSVVNLTPPPPPPAEEAPPPPPSKPQIVSPPPIVQVPVPVAQVQTTPDPTPQPPKAPAVSAPSSAPSFAAPAPPSTVQGGDLGTQMVSGKPPRYPIESRRKKEQGTVVLTLTLAVDGSVESIAIARSSGFSRLDDAARDAVRRWRWKPMIQQGQPVRVKGVVEIPFILQVAST